MTLSCRVSGDPAPDFTWTRDGKTLKIGKKYIVSQSPEQKIRICSSLECECVRHRAGGDRGGNGVARHEENQIRHDRCLPRHCVQ